MPATELQARNLAPSLTEAAGLTLDSEPGDLGWGSIGFTLTDPDGYKLTISRE